MGKKNTTAAAPAPAHVGTITIALSSVQDIGEELWNVRALAKALHDTLDWDKCNAERRVLRMIDERLAAIHDTM